jgi:signal transduction histidine kinase
MMRSPGYFLASLALLFALVTLHAASTARRSQVELRAQMEQKGLALAETVEAGSRNAIRSNALIEELIAQRLLDNARLVDALLARPFDARELPRLAEQNRLRRIDLLDLEGRPWTPPPPRHPMMARMMGLGPDAARAGHAMMPPDSAAGERPMMRFMWGRRWAGPPEGSDAPAAPAAVRERRFWEGSLFGVAVGARSFPGIIAVHADADFIVRLRRDAGVERQIEDLGRQHGVAAVSLLGADLTVLAHSDPSRVGTRLRDDALARALADSRPLSRLVSMPRGGDGVAGGHLAADTTGTGRVASAVMVAGTEVFEVVRPVTLDGGRPALVTVALSTEPMKTAWRRDVRAGVVLGAGVLAAGALGMAAIFVVQHRHLGERRQLEREMERRERLSALGGVAAAFAHEVRNPLNAVSMGLQRLRAEFAAEPAEEYARFVDLIQGEVRRLNAIVEQFLSLARPLPLQPAPFAVDTLLRELAALVDGQSRDTGIALTLALPRELPPLVADRDHVKQVLLNLVLNAVQAMSGGGTLTLGAGTGGGEMVLTVADTGPGMSAEVRARVFDPYFTTRPDGLGLGLPIARRIVEAHGGTIGLETAPGAGARFMVRLPLRP